MEEPGKETEDSEDVGTGIREKLFPTGRGRRREWWVDICELELFSWGRQPLSDRGWEDVGETFPALPLLPPVH